MISITTVGVPLQPLSSNLSRSQIMLRSGCMTFVMSCPSHPLWQAHIKGSSKDPAASILENERI